MAVSPFSRRAVIVQKDGGDENWEPQTLRRLNKQPDGGDVQLKDNQQQTQSDLIKPLNPEDLESVAGGGVGNGGTGTARTQRVGIS